MKIKRFLAEGVHGHMNFDIDFDDRLNFLIGINGSGKTTILRLIAGLLLPSPDVLINIEFRKIEVKCMYGQKEIKEFTVSSTKDSNKIIFRYTDKITYIEDVIAKTDNIFVSGKSNWIRQSDNARSLTKVRTFSPIKFMGIDRTDNLYIHNICNNDDYIIKRVSIHDKSSNSRDIDYALDSIIKLLYDETIRIADSQYKISEEFRRRVFEESFKIRNVSSMPPKIGNERHEIKKKIRQLHSSMEQLDMMYLFEDFQSYLNSLLSILDELEEIMNKDNKKDPTWSRKFTEHLLNWITNRTELEKIDKIIYFAKQYGDSILKSRKQIDSFKNGINLFLRDSGKSLTIDSRGEISISLPNNKKTNNVYGLSSGEKQLIILLGNIALLRGTAGTPTCIIDEPEISLHIVWQEIFVEALLAANPDAQFIFATHSPSIVSKMEYQKFCIDLTNKAYLCH